MEKRKVTVYINEMVWRRFLQKVLAKHGRAAGGAISEEVERSIKTQMKK
ncbi:MAG: hypothetical protein HYW25_02355 [Candidatus Aenigmarchaeota archaeon]|nr:hypothetical protein [Candidatus Aenigmarchaeota archaeon]